MFVSFLVVSIALLSQAFGQKIAPTQATTVDVVLTGEITGKQNRTYVTVPFHVPAGVHRISVDFSYTGKEQRATLDLGIFDPERFRGESGGNKSHFTLSETDATPSYLPGAIPAGEWKLLVAVPNMRPEVISRYRAEIRFNAKAEDEGFSNAPLASGLRWYRGDLHMHTAHSDGRCRSQGGLEVPCPLFLSVQQAASRDLNFLAITDHNTDSHYDALRELQPYFDHLLLIPGREITTFHGHFNVFGVTQFIDWRVTDGGRDLNAILHDVHVLGGIASVNHAEAPEGEECMGCRWMPSSDTDMGLFAGIEVINYGDVMFSSAKYWDGQLSQGHRLAALGGSDNHNATIPPGEVGAIGWPTTVIEAEELSVPAVLHGIGAGRTFVDLTASRDKVVDFEATSGGSSARMGETLLSVDGAAIVVRIHTLAAKGSFAHLLMDGQELGAIGPLIINSRDSTVTASLNAGPGRHWLRVEVRDQAGTCELMSSPLYINFGADADKR